MVDPTGTNSLQGGSLSFPSVVNLAQVNGASISLGQTTMAASLPVVIASNQSRIPVSTAASSTGTLTLVASTASDVTILSANPSRFGFSIINNSTAPLYVLNANATSSTTSFSVVLFSNGYFESPFGYTGIVKGLWLAANGTANVTEYT